MDIYVLGIALTPFVVLEWATLLFVLKKHARNTPWYKVMLGCVGGREV